MKVHKSTEREPFMQHIRQFCVPLQIIEADDSPKNKGGVKFVGGTALLWESLDGRFLVTARHVWTELSSILEDKSRECRLVFHDSNGPVVIQKPIPVGESEKLDLVIFTAKGLDKFVLTGRQFLRSLSWPPKPVQSGEAIVSAGYPGKARIFKYGRWHLNIMFLHFQRCEVSKYGTSIILGAESTNGYLGTFTDLPARFSLPGISGAPIYAIRGDRLDWVGVIRSGVGSPKIGDHMIWATPNHFILSDGTISGAP